MIGIKTTREPRELEIPYVLFVLLIILVTTLVASASMAQGPADTRFTFQGRLEENGVPAEGDFDFEFEAYSDPSAGAGTFLGSVTRTDIAVVNGIFTVLLDFSPNIFEGDAVWLKVATGPAGSSTFTDLLPLLEVTAAPYATRALVANDAELVDGVEASAFYRKSGGLIGGYAEFASTFGLLSTEGARIETGAYGETFQFFPGSTSSHIAIFNDHGGAAKVSIDNLGRVGIGTFSPTHPLSVEGDSRIVGNVDVTGDVVAGSVTAGSALVSGDLFVGGQCFRPRALVRCALGGGIDHLTWLGNAQECSDAGGTVEGQTQILAACPPLLRGSAAGTVPRPRPSDRPPA